MNEQQKQDLAAECRRTIIDAEKPGAGYRTVARGEIARIALAALTQPANHSENIRNDALCDTNYARGVAHGWNLAQNGDSEGMRKCIESRTTAAMSALAQPASPALKLPDVPPNALVALCEQMYDHRSTGATVAHDVWQVCIEELLMDAPHTAPIEPICATGGAEWVKCSERMPLELSDEHISEVEVIVTDGNKVGTCECRRGYMPCPWVEWSNYGDIDAEKITHWMPLPAAPEEE